MIGKYKNTKAIGTIPLSNWGGIEILEIGDDYIVACTNYGNGRKQLRHHMIHYSILEDGRSYFIKLGNKYYLDEILRCN